MGGGDAGATSTRRLLRAVEAGRLRTDEIVVVDRDPRCAAADLAAAVPRAPVVRLDVADWTEWLDRCLGLCRPDDHVVPYHWAPHLFLTWLEREVARAGGTSRRETPPLDGRWPFERATRAGDAALSYATWTCPPACIEPALCPHTRGPRDWSLAGDLAAAGVAAAEESIVLASFHLVWGVATVPVRALLEARRRVLAGPGAGPRAWVVSTASHCHGLSALLRVTRRR